MERLLIVDTIYSLSSRKIQLDIKIVFYSVSRINLNTKKFYCTFLNGLIFTEITKMLQLGFARYRDIGFFRISVSLKN